MSLLADLRDSFRGARAPRAETPAPVPFTGASAAWSWGSGGTEPTRRELEMTTAESTLYSVLDLISGDVGTVRWDLHRGDAQADMAPPEGSVALTERQHLAVKLWNQPNDFMTGEHLRTVCAWHFDAVGEAWQVCDYAAPGVPLSFWPVRPDRMKPITDPDAYILGYVYIGPSGERIPLELNEVLRITRPHPYDPHRGIGPVPALMLPLGTSLTSQEWIQSFYRNDATPGGMLELGQDEILSDDDYKTFITRWNEQHKGVSRAHRIGVLELGEYKPVPINFKDLQVTELRHLNRDQVLEAYQLNKFMIGATDDVNRAASLAANDTYARRILTRRVKYWSALANGPYLRCFGTTGQGVVWCPENVIPADQDAENADRESRAKTYQTYIESGMEHEDACALAGIPTTTRHTGSVPGSRRDTAA